MGITSGRGSGKRLTPAGRAAIDAALRVDSSNLTTIAKKFGVTDSAVRKRAVAIGAQLRGNVGRERNTTIRASRSPTVTDLGWAAGFLEGEGSFVRCGYASQAVTAVQADQEPLLRLQEIFGGRITKKAPEANRLSRKGFYRWGIAGARARGVMYTLYTMMTIRRQAQIRSALNYSRTLQAQA